MVEETLYLNIRKIFCILGLFFAPVSAFAEDYVIMDDETEVFLSEIVGKLKDALGYKSEVKVYISSDRSINAAAIQSGDIVVNAGALIQSSDYREIIAILAHEVGHIEGRHIQLFISQTRDFVKAGLVPALIGAVTAICSGNPAPLIAGMAGSQSMTQGMALSKLRQKENIADTKAAEAMKKLKWPIFEGFVSIHKKLENKSFAYNEYLSTHPLPEKRISKYNEYLEQSKSWQVSEKTKATLSRFEKTFARIKLKMNALTAPKDSLKALYQNPKNENEKYARAVVLYRMGRYSESLNLMNELDKNDNDISAYFAEIKCMALINMKRCSESAKVATEALKNIRRIKDHRDLAVIHAEAVIAGNLINQVPEAIKNLEKVLFPKEDDLSVLTELGKLYSMSKQDSKASWCAAKSSFLIGDFKLAKFHAKRAMSSSDKSIRMKAQDVLNSIDESEKDNSPE